MKTICPRCQKRKYPEQLLCGSCWLGIDGAERADWIHRVTGADVAYDPEEKAMCFGPRWARPDLSTPC